MWLAGWETPHQLPCPSLLKPLAHSEEEMFPPKEGPISSQGHGPPPQLKRFLTYWWSRVIRASQVAQWVKNPPAMQETRVRSLAQEDALEEETATHSSMLAWIIPWTEEPGGLQSMGSQKVGHDWALTYSMKCWEMSSIVIQFEFNHMTTALDTALPFQP